jgi:hypothetical protein
MVASQTNGELTLKLPMIAQFASRNPAPNRIRVISTESSTRSSAVTEPR